MWTHWHSPISWKVARPALFMWVVGWVWTAPLTLSANGTLPGSFDGHMEARVKRVNPNPLMRSTDRGYVFMQGRYLASPYRFQTADSTLRLNGIDLREAGLSFAKYNGDMNLAAIDMHSWLCERNVLVLNPFKDPAMLMRSRAGGELLATLLHKSDVSQTATPELIEWTQRHATGLEEWRNLVANFQMTAEFEQRAEADTEQLSVLARENEAVSLRVQLESFLEYPLTILGFCLLVFSTGQLLSYRPRELIEYSESDKGTEAMRALYILLGLIIAFSLLDLGWTLIHGGAGSMREVNPFAIGLLATPINLVVFKTSLVCIAAIILHRLRGLRLAKMATWWLCLLLTLVTLRWLAFHALLDFA